MTYEEYIKNPTGKSAVFGAGLKLQIKDTMFQINVLA